MGSVEDMAHVAIVCRNYPPVWGGAERVAEQLARELACRGHRVTVLTAWHTGLARREKTAAGIEIARLGFGGEAGKLSSLSLTLHLLWTIARCGRAWDALHNFLVSTLSVPCTLWAFWTNRPFFVSLGGTGPTSDLSQMFSLSWQGERKFRFIARRARFIACSSESRDQLRAIPISKGNLHLLPNPVDLKRFCPADAVRRKELRLGLNLTGPVVLFVGRLVSVKGLDRLWKAWPEVRQKYPDALLVVVGDGPERTALKKQCPTGARLEGACDPVPYYQAAELFVLPSRSEGMSLALLEAMACGLPVVATDVSGSKELVTDGETGWIVENTDDPRPLVEGLFRGLLAGVREELGPKARAQVETSYGLDQWMTTVLKLYGIGQA